MAASHDGRKGWPSIPQGRLTIRKLRPRRPSAGDCLPQIPPHTLGPSCLVLSDNSRACDTGSADGCATAESCRVAESVCSATTRGKVVCDSL